MESLGTEWLTDLSVFDLEMAEAQEEAGWGAGEEGFDL